MIVDAVIFHWTATGMRERIGQGNYIEQRDVERLLEEAHERGRKVGLEQATEIVNKSFPPYDNA